MKIIRIVLLFAVFCVTLSSSFPDAVVAPALAQGISADRYHCPMHPAIVQDRKGDCPICGMKLVPFKEASSAAPGAVAASADRQKILGIVVSQVQRSEGTRALRFVGRVMPDEKRVFKINGGIEGSIRDVAPVTTGSRVKKDQVLGSFWAPNALYDPAKGHDLYREYINTLAYAEELGFDGICVNEHHQNAYGLMPSPMSYPASKPSAVCT